MSTINISLSAALKHFVDEQIAARGHRASGEHVRELIRRDQYRQRLRGLLLDGACSAPDAEADATYFDGLRQRVRRER